MCPKGPIHIPNGPQPRRNERIFKICEWRTWRTAQCIAQRARRTEHKRTAASPERNTPEVRTRVTEMCRLSEGHTPEETQTADDPHGIDVKSKH